MGSSGIRRRRSRHAPRRPELHDPGISDGDVDRLFGKFSYDAYTPAGNLERNGFFLRQLSRNGTRGAWAFVAQAKWVFVAIAVLVAAGVSVSYLLH